jgi:hypothetical protein
LLLSPTLRPSFPYESGGRDRPTRNPQQGDSATLGCRLFNEFNTDQKIADVIRSGSVIGRAPIVSMPHWGGIIPDQQLQALVAYIKTLNTR